jgi:hypothetical protein
MGLTKIFGSIQPPMRREDFDEEWIGVALSHLVIPEDRGQCWGWDSTVNSAGYPKFARWSAKYHNGDNGRCPCGRKRTRPVMMHRLMYCVEIGPIGEGMVIDHLCNNRGCCNPSHLQMTTPKNNLLRTWATLAGANARKSRCPKCGDGYREKARTNGKYVGRYCPTCMAQHRRRWKEKRKTEAGIA